MFISNIRFLTEASPSVGPRLSALDSSSIDSAQYAAQAEVAWSPEMCCVEVWVWAGRSV